MTIDEILHCQNIFRAEFPKSFRSDVLRDYITILQALSIHLERLANNKSLPDTYRIAFQEDFDMLQSVLNDLKKFN